MKVITAPEYYVPKKTEITVFLAGGITNCENWQQKVIKYLQAFPDDQTENLVIFNPRRDAWPSSADTEEIRRQIHWEADYICHSDIFSMYFANTKKSDQPICFYELGKYADSRSVISYQAGFARPLDVKYQLEVRGIEDRINENFTPVQHAEAIMNEYEEELEKISRIRCYRR